MQLIQSIYAGLVCFACLSSSGGSFAQSPADTFEALLKKGFALHQEARFTEAIPLLERARELQPSDYFANLLLGIDRLRTGDAKAAVTRLQAAARANPQEALPQEYLGEAEARLGNYAQAAEAYQRGLARGQGAEALEAWAGFALERFHDIGSELRSTDAGVAAIRTMQDAAKAGTALKCGAPVPELERKLAKGGATAGENAHVARQLAMCYSVEAGKAAEKLKNEDNDAALGKLRGDILLRLKEDPKAAEAEYRKAIDEWPGDPALVERLAEARFAAGDVDGARDAAKAALVLDPHRREAMRILAMIAMDDRDYAGALPILRQLSLEAPADLSVQVELGRALALTGDAEGGLKYLAPALTEGYPDEKGSLHALEARVLRQLGREEEAAKASAEARRRSDAFQESEKNGGKEKTRADH